MENQLDLKALADKARRSPDGTACVNIGTLHEQATVEDCIDMVQTGSNSYAAPPSTLVSSVLPPRNNGLPYSPSTNPIYNKYVSSSRLPQSMVTSISEFVKYVTKYICPKKKIKKVKKLLTKELSRLFKTILGYYNTANIQRIDNDVFSLNVIAGYIEQIACNCFLSKDNTVLNDFLSAMTDSGQISCSFFNGELHWRIGYIGRQGKGFINLVKEVFTISFADAVATACKIIAYDVNNFFKTYNHTPRKADNMYSGNIDNQVLHSFPLLKQYGTVTIAQLVKLIPILGYSKQIIGAIAMYAVGEEQLCLPVSVVRGKLSIGKCQANPYLLNQNLIDENPSAIVIFCYDMKTAIALDELVKGLSSDISRKYIVTAHLGDDCSVIPWSYLLGHKVIFVGAPCDDAFENIGEYENFIIGAGAESFSVYPYLILHTESNKSHDLEEGEKLTQGEEILLETATYLSRVEHVPKFLEKIVKESLTSKEYIAFWQSKGLFIAKKESLSTVKLSSATLLQSSFSLSLASSSGSPLSINTVQEILPTAGLSTARGGKNNGKSYIGLGLIRWKISGDGFINGIDSCEGGRVLLIDSETIPSVLRKRIYQMKLDTYVGSSLHIISKEDPSDNNIWKNIDLSSEEYRVNITRYAQENNIIYIFLDNLTSLVGKGRMYEPKAMEEIYKWAEDLRKIGIGVCFVNHNLEDKGHSTLYGKGRGSNEFSIRSHTEIVIIGSDEITENKSWPQIAKDYSKKHGITLGLCFKTCKMAPLLERKVFWLHLPYDASDWVQISVTDFEGEPVDWVSPNPVAEAIEAQSQLSTETITDADESEKPVSLEESSLKSSSAPLSKNANFILKYLSESSKSTFTKEDIINDLELTEAQFRSAIDKLRSNGKVELVESGRSSYYKLVE